MTGPEELHARHGMTWDTTVRDVSAVGADRDDDALYRLERRTDKVEALSRFRSLGGQPEGLCLL
jgi:hypothetical protein